jgi:hypothetical protein
LTGEHCRKTLTRRGFTDVESTLETWDGAIRTVLYRDGTYQVFVGEKYSPTNLVAEGNVNQ